MSKKLAPLILEKEPQTTIPSFDYDGVRKADALVAKHEALAIRDLHESTAQAILKIGQKLLAMKTLLGHGSFGPWLALECRLDHRTANRYMRAATSLADKIDTVSNLKVSTVHALAGKSVPAEKRDSLLLQLANDEITEKDLLVSLNRSERRKTASAMVSTPVDPANAADDTIVHAQIEFARFLGKHLSVPPWKLREMVERAGLSEFVAVMISVLGPMEKPELKRGPDEPALPFMKEL